MVCWVWDWSFSWVMGGLVWVFGGGCWGYRGGICWVLCGLEVFVSGVYGVEIADECLYLYD